MKILVGEANQEFNVPKSLICAESEFFKLACNERWDSGRTNTVTLKEDSPKTFSIFLAWLLLGDIRNSADLTPLKNVDSFNYEAAPATVISRLSTQWGELIHCYVLGDSSQAANFCNHIMDALLLTAEIMNEKDLLLRAQGHHAMQYSYIFSNTARGSPLRRLAVDYHIANAPFDIIEEDLRYEGIADFYQDLARQAMQVMDYGRRCPSEEEPDFYYILPGKSTDV